MSEVQKQNDVLKAPEGESNLNQKLEQETLNILEKVGQKRNVKDFFETNYGEKYTGEEMQLRRAFSLAFIMLRDGEINGHNLVNVEVSQLNIRNEDGVAINSVNKGQTLTLLGEEKQIFVKKFNKKLSFTKVKYTDPSGKEITGYVSNSTRYISPLSKTSRGLNSYLKSNGLKAIPQTKESYYKEMDNLGEYKGTENQNTELYHYLVQKFEISKLREEIKAETQRQTQEVKDDVESNPKNQKPTPAEKAEPKAKSQEQKEEQSAVEKNETFKGKRNEIYNKIKEDDVMQSFLQKNYKGDFDYFIYKVFGKRNGISEIDITSMARAYAWLRMNAHNEWKLSYKRKYRKKFPNRKTDDKTLLEKYSPRTSFGGSETLKILYGLVIEVELGEDILNMMEKVNTVEREFAHGLDQNDIIGYGVETKNGVTQCSKTARKNLQKLGAHPKFGDSDDLIRQLKNNGGTRVSNGRLIGSLETKAKENNVFDIYPETNNGHRAVAFLGKNGNFYVLDPYYGTRSKRPQLLQNRVSAMKGNCNEIVIGPAYQVSSKS